MMRVSGQHERVQPPPIVTKVHDLSDSSLHFTDKQPDCVFGFSDPEDQPRVKMSCGHAVDANSLTVWCRSLLDQQQWEFYCPAMLPGSNKQCKVKWEYAEVRKIALLSDAEKQYFETKMSEYAAHTVCDYRECPGCSTFIERLDNTNLRVHCEICTEKKGKNYEFCWNCSEEWTGTARGSNIKCRNRDCEHPSLSAIRNAPMMTINGQRVPKCRACPTCGYVVEHSGGSCCKMCVCPQCKKEFCFLCLLSSDACLKTAPGSHHRECKKDVAPKQTVIPAWFY